MSFRVRAPRRARELLLITLRKDEISPFVEIDGSYYFSLRCRHLPKDRLGKTRIQSFLPWR